MILPPTNMARTRPKYNIGVFFNQQEKKYRQGLSDRSITLLRNRKNIIPLDRAAKLLVLLPSREINALKYALRLTSVTLAKACNPVKF